MAVHPLYALVFDANRRQLMVLIPRSSTDDLRRCNLGSDLSGPPICCERGYREGHRIRR
jgi:hypothetical protein